MPGTTGLIAPDRCGLDINACSWAHAHRKLMEITCDGTASITGDDFKWIAMVSIWCARHKATLKRSASSSEW
jgi:hypothetical protein